MEQWRKTYGDGPPAWFRWSSWVMMGLTSIVVAVVILLQWAVWMILTSQLFSPWGMILGIVVSASQILLMFGRERSAKATCAIPKKP